MKAKVETMDREGRILLGLGLLSLVYFIESGERWLGLAGVAPLLTGMLGACPAKLLGRKSCPANRHD